MVGWHHRINGHEFEQAPGDSERQGSLACCIHGVLRVRHDLGWFWPMGDTSEEWKGREVEYLCPGTFPAGLQFGSDLCSSTGSHSPVRRLLS